MVARINTSKSISKALNYNEQKVSIGKAECILASAFIQDWDQLNFYDKLHHFERLILLNENTIINTLHVSCCRWCRLQNRIDEALKKEQQNYKPIPVIQQ